MLLLIIYFSVCFVSYHHQVVKLIDVFPYGTGFVLVFEYMLSDLSEVLRNSARPLTEVGTVECTSICKHLLVFSCNDSFLITCSALHPILQVTTFS